MRRWKDRWPQRAQRAMGPARLASPEEVQSDARPSHSRFGVRQPGAALDSFRSYLDARFVNPEKSRCRVIALTNLHNRQQHMRCPTQPLVLAVALSQG